MATPRAAVPAASRKDRWSYWMRDLVDITLLDYIFSQQDRIGNIDYLTYWYWVEDGQVRRMPAQAAILRTTSPGWHPSC